MTPEGRRRVLGNIKPPLLLILRSQTSLIFHSIDFFNPIFPGVGKRPLQIADQGAMPLPPGVVADFSGSWTIKRKQTIIAYSIVTTLSSASLILRFYTRVHLLHSWALDDGLVNPLTGKPTPTDIFSASCDGMDWLHCLVRGYSGR